MFLTTSSPKSSTFFEIIWPNWYSIRVQYSNSSFLSFFTGNWQRLLKRKTNLKFAKIAFKLSMIPYIIKICYRMNFRCLFLCNRKNECDFLPTALGPRELIEVHCQYEIESGYPSSEHLRFQYRWTTNWNSHTIQCKINTLTVLLKQLFVYGTWRRTDNCQWFFKTFHVLRLLAWYGLEKERENERKEQSTWIRPMSKVCEMHAKSNSILYLV